ncbi:histone-fold-containing protein [Aspergillus avenaceus]|uniref:DNA polymerase epsilon subunit D n=1 Tax=Aspergillus avenaceus TaxID=36643 RepID=A0A5N6TUW5_ASPAV|nr:histone-fold-containing protein [Aspergillus avenaceus]
MPRKSTSSQEEEPLSTPQPTPPSQSQSQSQSQPNIQATEQQLKARAEGVSIEDYLLPRSLTLRLAKSVLPPNTSIQKDAVLAIQKAATVFVSYLSSHANEATLKRTVAPSDVFAALTELEFDSFRGRLEKELDAFTEAKAGKRRGKKDASAASASAVKEDERGAKRVKRDGLEVRGEEGDESQDEGGDEVEGENEAEHEHEHEHEHESEEGEEEGEDEEEEGEEVEDDIDRVEDLDRDVSARRMDPDAAESDSEDEAGPSSQLRGDLGLG